MNEETYQLTRSNSVKTRGITTENRLKGIQHYLHMARLPSNITAAKQKIIKRRTIFFYLSQGLLFKSNNRGGPRQEVLNKTERLTLLFEFHEMFTGGHKGRDATFGRLAAFYWWPKIYTDVQMFVQTCDVCQRRDKRQYEEELQSLPIPTVFRRIHIKILDLFCHPIIAGTFQWQGKH